LIVPFKLISRLMKITVFVKSNLHLLTG